MAIFDRMQRDLRIIECYKTMSLRDTANQFGLTKERIRQIIKEKSPDILRSPHYSIVDQLALANQQEKIK